MLPKCFELVTLMSWWPRYCEGLAPYETFRISLKHSFLCIFELTRREESLQRGWGGDDLQKESSEHPWSSGVLWEQLLLSCLHLKAQGDQDLGQKWSEKAELETLGFSQRPQKGLNLSQSRRKCVSFLEKSVFNLDPRFFSDW